MGLELRPCEIKFHDFPVEPSRSPCLFVFIEDFIEVVFFFFLNEVVYALNASFSSVLSPLFSIPAE